MLKKQNRITKNKEFLKIFKTVRPYYTEHLVLRIVKQNQKLKIKNQKYGDPLFTNKDDRRYKTGQSRFGFVVSNKIDKRAARRNGLKRRIRAVIEANLINIREGYDVVIQVKKPFNHPYNYSEIERKVLKGLQSSGIMGRVETNHKKINDHR